MPQFPLSVVHPCFNEQENIAQTVQETLAWFDKQNIDGEVVVTDDGSRDASPTILADLAKQDSRVHVVTHETNQGYGRAVRSGCDSARKEHIAFVDSDGQFHIEDLSLLLPFLNEYGFVTGRRRNRADPFVRNMFGKVLGILIVLVFRVWLRDVNCGMKVFRRSIWDEIRPLYGTEKFFNTELFLRLKRGNHKWKQVDVPHYPRRAGTPTGGSIRVIGGMLKELLMLKRNLEL